MTAFLHRLGRFAHRHPWRVIVTWLVLVAGICVTGFGFGGTLADSFNVPGTESQAALDRLDAVFPQAAGGSAQVILVAPEGERIDGASEKSAIADTVTALKKVQGIESVTSPFSQYATNAVSSNHRAAVIAVQFTKADEAVADSTVTGMTKTESIGKDAGLKVAYSGQVFQSTAPGGGPGEVLGVLFAGVVLVITFGSLIAAGMPLITAIVGVAVAYAGIRIVALFTTVSTTAPILALMLGLAVGIDYALFIISRHRQQLATGMPVAESIPSAIATAGTAVLFAGTTVIIALLGLLIVGIPFLSIMGVGAAVAVFLAVATSTTLLPALLALAGERLVPKPNSRAAKRAIASSRGEAKSMGAKWVALVGKAPIVAVVLVVGALGTLALPAANLELALPNNGSQPVGTTSRTAYDLTEKYFGAGRNGPLVILADVTQNNNFIDDLKSIRHRIEQLPDVESVGSATPNETLDTAIIQVIPKSGPSSPATLKLVERIRGLESDFKRDYDIPIQVTGTTAVQIDVSARLLGALVPFAVVVVGLSMILLMAVFRSLIVPLKAAVGFLLSMLAALGVTVGIFQEGWFDALGTVPGPLLSFLPILVVAILFGLSMDYEVFLVSGMRETWAHTKDAKLAVHRGFADGARVVTAAALIMTFVFAAFIPDGSSAIKPIATALAAGIVFDAFLVRMTLVPAVMFLAGRAGWYFPKWLSRVLPTIDIEGEHLLEHRRQQQWVETQHGYLLSAEGLVPAAPFGDDPLSLRVTRGAIVRTDALPGMVRGVVATLSGQLAPASGDLQVDGHPAPTEAAHVRRLAAAVFDDPAAASLSVRELVLERSRTVRRRDRPGTADGWVDRLRAADPALTPPRPPAGASAR